jgi:hypothetical protein
VEHIEQLIIDLKESLEREIGSLRQEMRDGFTAVTNRFDDQSARLDRHAGLWQTGSRWSARMDAWAEKVDGSLEAKDREIAELRERLLRLERKSA